ncbi:hypothetical protein [Achromobacter insolitus]|uniref:hypothetical protein n=1 Tax=Achromobacter insolitus TaxID=217204 RepID=UPI000B1F203D|nr:hypothetical protein [Achromobacter insolitus]
MTDQNNAAQPADVLVDYEVYQEDELVASSNSLAHAEQYAEQYRQDGPVELRTTVSFSGFHAVESALLSKLRAPVADERQAVDPCGYVAVKRSAVDWLKDKFPALTIKAGLCERIGGRLYTITRLMRDHDAALASAPVAGEAQQVIHQHGFAADNQRLRAINESLDKQLEEVMTERDEYHDVADKLANAIADHLLVEIGEHSSSNCPWMRALEAIENAAPQASEAVRDVNHPVFAFLLGEGPLRGVHFGDRHPDERGAYWWRKDLRAALSAQPGAQKEQSDA